MVISQKHKLLDLLYSRAVFFPTFQLTKYPYDPHFASVSELLCSCISRSECILHDMKDGLRMRFPMVPPHDVSLTYEKILALSIEKVRAVSK